MKSVAEAMPFSPALDQVATPKTVDAQTILMVEPPEVGVEEAKWVAEHVYGWQGEVELLSGERDKNFLLRVDDANHDDVVIKFINPAETSAEMDVQIKVLQWLEKTTHQVVLPRALPTKSGDNLYLFDQHGVKCCVRAYTFVPGHSVLKLSVTSALCRSYGHTAAQMVLALDGFDHPALSRELLWDLMHVGKLDGWARDILPEGELKQFILQLLAHFNQSLLPQLRALPQQVIHSDLSRSNTVVSAAQADELYGVLDFGDLSKAPRIVELAIAASYALDSVEEPLSALQTLVAGYEELLPLKPLEKDLLLNLIAARLAQRIVISEWRASRFPDNRDYILRSTTQAKALMGKLMPHLSFE